MVVAEFWHRHESNQLTISSPGKKTCQIGEILYQLRVASRHFKIQGLQVNIHCSRNQRNAVTKLSRMNVGQKNSSLTPKKSAKTASCDDATLLARCVCL